MLANSNIVGMETNSQDDQPVLNILGVYFCPHCRNMMEPSQANEQFLEFECMNCGPRQVDFSGRTQPACVLYNKDMKGRNCWLT